MVLCRCFFTVLLYIFRLVSTVTVATLFSIFYHDAVYHKCTVSLNINPYPCLIDGTCILVKRSYKYLNMDPAMKTETNMTAYDRVRVFRVRFQEIQGLAV